MNVKAPSELQSKKWRSMVLALAAMMFEHSQDAPWYMVVSVAVVASVYLVSQGIADQGKAKAQLIIEAIREGHIPNRPIENAKEAAAKLE